MAGTRLGTQRTTGHGNWKEILALATTVIIPARNEQATIGAIIAAFHDSSVKCEIFVGIDADTIDDTVTEVKGAGGAIPVRTTQRGKGQVVWQTLVTAHILAPISDRIVTCDADYTGLTGEHITNLIKEHHQGMTIGVPDFPPPGLPAHVYHAWPRVSGLRCFPWRLLNKNAHGYLLETQLNLNAITAREPFNYINMDGLHSPFQWPMTGIRNDERLRDEKWGQEHGVLQI